MSFDPLHRLITDEAFRFIGTVGDVTSQTPEIYLTILAQYQGRETRSKVELASAIMKAASCDKRVATNTLAVAEALRLVDGAGGAGTGPSKYAIGEHGRVINALRAFPSWERAGNRCQLFIRPMFEAHGDYLLQAMDALHHSNTRADALRIFRRLVREAADAKLDEVRNVGLGAKWDAYHRGLEGRRKLMLGDTTPSSDVRTSLAELQRARRLDEAKFRKSRQAPQQKTPKFSVADSQIDASETKTLEHQFARCRAWLIGLGLIAQTPESYAKLTPIGERLRDHFDLAMRHKRPARIPPSVATLEDCFRLTRTEITDIWGTCVDDAFWEEAILSLSSFGTYTPSPEETIASFSQAFDSVRVSGISEVNLVQLREVLFFGWLWENKPLRSTQLDEIIMGDRSIPRLFPNQFGYGRNRQGRIAYLFRK